MANSKRITAYVVQRLSWEYGDDFYYRRPEEDAPMKTFLDRNKAEAYRKELEWEHVRASKINPFGYVDAALEERSSLPLPELLERFRTAGITLEGEGDQRYVELWTQYEQLPDEGKRMVWLAVDRLRFFELIEMTIDLEG